MSMCAPAVVSAYTHLLLCHTDNSIVYRWKLEMMCSIFQLMWCIWQCRERKLITKEQHASALLIHYLCISYSALVAALLRNEILGNVVCHFILVYTILSAMLSVLVCLLWSESVPFHCIIIGIQLEHHAKLRHIAKFLYRVI